MPTPDDELSQYEVDRLDNIRRNQEHLAFLGLEAAPSATKRNIKRQRRDPSQHPQVAPSRSSARIEGASAPDYFVEAETAHGSVTVGGGGGALMAEAISRERESTRAAERAAAAIAIDPLAAFGLGAMPASESELLDAERDAYATLRAAKNTRAGEEGTAAYHIAQNRSLCELVRRVPTTTEQLQACWGFGGEGIKVARLTPTLALALALVA